MTELPPPGTIEPEVIAEPEPALAPIMRRPRDHSTSGRWFMSLGVFLLGITAVLAVIITIPGIRNNGNDTRATRDELACRAVSQVALESARAELQRGQAHWAEALGTYLVASEDVLRNVLAGHPDAATDPLVVQARSDFEAAADELRALDPPLVKAITDRDASAVKCNPHSVGAETP